MAQYPALNSCTYFSLSLEAVLVLAEVAAENSVSLTVEILTLNTAQTLLLLFCFFTSFVSMLNVVI